MAGSSNQTVHVGRGAGCECAVDGDPETIGPRPRADQRADVISKTVDCIQLRILRPYTAASPAYARNRKTNEPREGWKRSRVARPRSAREDERRERKWRRDDRQRAGAQTGMRADAALHPIEARRRHQGSSRVRQSPSDQKVSIAPSVETTVARIA